MSALDGVARRVGAVSVARVLSCWFLGCWFLGCVLTLGLAPVAHAARQSEAAQAESPRATAIPSEARLARTMAELPRAEAGAWVGWHAAPVPPLYLAALEAYRAEDLMRTWNLVCDTLERAPDHPAALSLAGGVAFRLRRYGDTVVAFERFLVHAPEEVARTRHLGHAYHSLGRHDEARVHYERVLAAPDLESKARQEARLGHALACYRGGDSDAARRDLDGLLELNPGDSEVLTWRATVAFDDEELALAITLAERAASRAPFDPRPVYLLARARGELLAILDEDFAGLPQDDAGRVRDVELTAEREALRAAVVRDETRFAQLAAIDVRSRELEAELTLTPGNHAARRELARLNSAIGDSHGALKQAAYLARTAAEDGESQLVVLELLVAHGRPESATAHATLLEAAFDEDPSVLERLALFYAERGDLQSRLRVGARAAQLRAREAQLRARETGPRARKPEQTAR